MVFPKNTNKRGMNINYSILGLFHLQSRITSSLIQTGNVCKLTMMLPVPEILEYIQKWTWEKIWWSEWHCHSLRTPDERLLCRERGEPSDVPPRVGSSPGTFRWDRVSSLMLNRIKCWSLVNAMLPHRCCSCVRDSSSGPTIPNSWNKI